LHDKIALEVRLEEPVAEGQLGKVKLQVFDPDHAFNPSQPSEDLTLDRNDSAIPYERLPGDNIVASSGDDRSEPATLASNEDGIGGHIVGGIDILEFAPAEQIKKAYFQITARQPGNNFRAVAIPKAHWVDGIKFLSDGYTLATPANAPIAKERRTGVTTVWRSLHLEFDTTVAAGPLDGPFDGEPGANDDPRPLGTPPTPPANLLPDKYLPANVVVRNDLGLWDVRNEASFVHYVGNSIQEVNQFSIYDGDSVRDVRSEDTFFWVIQFMAGYEFVPQQDYDDDGEFAMFGYNLGPHIDGPTTLFYETMRDFSANAPDFPAGLSLSDFYERTALHESVHRFNMYHGDPDGLGDVGPLNTEDNNINGTLEDNDLTLGQLGRIQATARPR
jgi:hypothetical protein